MLTRAKTELSRTAESNLRLLHLEILKLGIQDPDLAEVWPPYDGTVTERKNRQYLYANAIFQYHWTAQRVSDYTQEDTVESYKFLFTSPLMREYWKASRPGRAFLVAGSPGQVVAEI